MFYISAVAGLSVTYLWDLYVFCSVSVCAFHIRYDEMKLDANVGHWAVHVIEVSRAFRHLDRGALMSWEKLDK
jgi:parafibromin